MTTQTWTAWPDNPLWSWQVTRIIGLVDFGAANFAEIWEAVQRIRPRDEESWHQEWSRLGTLVESMAHEAEAAGNRLSARDSFSRAAQYFRLAHFFLPGDDARKLPTLHRMERCFKAGGRYFTPPNGADSLSEEVHFTTGRAAQEFGYNFLMFNAPGVGLRW
ncbi:MAG: hypothetical protein HYU24_14695 [Candidatus Rokubacteria bacterium]|nr:hypothetical protein [Candidatus Rokubacteria bacterium]